MKIVKRKTPTVNLDLDYALGWHNAHGVTVVPVSTAEGSTISWEFVERDGESIVNISDNKTITLQGGKAYKLRGYLSLGPENFSGSGNAQYSCQWWNKTEAEYIGSKGGGNFSWGDTGIRAYGGASPAICYAALSANSELELHISELRVFGSITDVAYQPGTSFEVEHIQNMTI